MAIIIEDHEIVEFVIKENLSPEVEEALQELFLTLRLRCPEGFTLLEALRDACDYAKFRADDAWKFKSRLDRVERVLKEFVFVLFNSPGVDDFLCEGMKYYGEEFIEEIRSFEQKVKGENLFARSVSPLKRAEKILKTTSSNRAATTPVSQSVADDNHSLEEKLKELIGMQMETGSFQKLVLQQIWEYMKDKLEINFQNKLKISLEEAMGKLEEKMQAELDSYLNKLVMMSASKDQAS